MVATLFFSEYTNMIRKNYGFLEERRREMVDGFLNWLTLIGFVVLVGNIMLSGLIVFFERRNPSSTWAWLLVLLFIPVLGFFLYMVFGRNSRREKMFLKKK